MGPVGVRTISLSFVRQAALQGGATVQGLQGTGGRQAGWITLKQHAEED